MLPDDQLEIAHVYERSRDEEPVVEEYLGNMVRKGKLRTSHSAMGSWILFIYPGNQKGLRLCVDYSNLNKYTVKNSLHLPIIDELQGRNTWLDYITKIVLKARFHLFWKPLGHEMCTNFRTKLKWDEYMVMPFTLTSVPATFPKDLSKILTPWQGNKLVIRSETNIDDNYRLVVVPYIENVLIAIMAPSRSIIDRRDQFSTNWCTTECVWRYTSAYFMPQKVHFCDALLTVNDSTLIPKQQWVLLIGQDQPTRWKLNWSGECGSVMELVHLPILQ